jgi:hypothetical protein
LVRLAARFDFESARRSAPAFISFACPKETNQRKGPPEDLPLAVARGSLRFSAKTGAAELAMLRMAQTVLALIGFVL